MKLAICLLSDDELSAFLVHKELMKNKFARVYFGNPHVMETWPAYVRDATIHKIEYEGHIEDLPDYQHWLTSYPFCPMKWTTDMYKMFTHDQLEKFHEWFSGEHIEYFTYIAAKAGAIKIFHELSKNWYEYTPELLICAIQGGNHEIVKSVFDKLGKFTIEHLQSAFQWYDEDIIEYILNNTTTFTEFDIVHAIKRAMRGRSGDCTMYLDNWKN